MFVFGSADLTGWVSRVSIQDEYDAVRIEPFGEIGVLVAQHQPRVWRITTQGFAFGDSIEQLRAVLQLAKKWGIQMLRFTPERAIPAYLERFQIAEWDGALLIPNVRMDFVGLGYAVDTTPSRVDWEGAANISNYYRTTNMTNAGQYDAPLRFTITLTYPHSDTSGNDDLYLALYVENYPTVIVHTLRFWVRNQTAEGTIVIDSGVEGYGVSYPSWYRLVSSSRGALPRLPVSPVGVWQVSLYASAYNNGLLRFSVASASVSVRQRYANW
jgi:hypothetical protein